MEILDFDKENKYIEKVKKINSDNIKKYYILTMGCMLNENDSEKLCGMIEKMGYEKCNNPMEANLIVFNTCCVRENAEDKLFRKTWRIKELQKRHWSNYCYWWLYDTGKTYSRKVKKELPIFRYNVWNSYH